MKIVWLFVFIILSPLSKAENRFFNNPISEKTVSVKSWKFLRDLNIVKQDQDFSCGAASIATLLNNFYAQK